MYAYTYLKGLWCQNHTLGKLVNARVKKIRSEYKQLVPTFLLILTHKNSELDYKINDIVFSNN